MRADRHLHSPIDSPSILRPSFSILCAPLASLRFPPRLGHRPRGNASSRAVVVARGSERLGGRAAASETDGGRAQQARLLEVYSSRDGCRLGCFMASGDRHRTRRRARPIPKPIRHGIAHAGAATARRIPTAAAQKLERPRFPIYPLHGCPGTSLKCVLWRAEGFRP